MRPTELLKSRSGHLSFLAVLLLYGLTASATERVQRPNLVFLFADQLRYQSCGYAGDERASTPQIDRLAQQGVSFRQFVVNTPVCTAYRATLLTGKYASSHGMVVNELRLNPNQDALGHLLSRAGYHTGYIGKWHLWANQAGNHWAIHNAYIPPGPYRMGFDDFWAAYNFNHHNYRAWYFRDDPEPHRIEGYGPDRFTDMAIDYLKGRAVSDDPFALVVSYSPPHPPMSKKNVPEQWYRKFEDMDFPLPPNWRDQPDQRADRFKDPKYFKQQVTDRYQDLCRAYYAMNANLDWNVGRILQALKDLGLDENTLVVFTSDHGEQLGSQGRIQKMIFYEESCRVPLLIRWPRRIPAGQASDSSISAVDLMPTLLGLMNLPIPKAVEGMNLAHLARGEAGPEPPFAFLQGMGHTYLWEDGFEWRAVRDKQYTYAVYRSDGKELLFDHQDDPYEMRNLAGESTHADTLREYRDKCRRKMAELNDGFHECTWYRDHWTSNRVIMRGARGEFHRQFGSDVEVDVHYNPVPLPAAKDSKGSGGQ